MPAPSSRGRRIALGAAALLAVLVAVVAGCEISGWRFLRPLVEARAGHASGATLRISGDFRLRLLRSPGLDAARLQVPSAPGFDAPLLVDAVGLRWRWRWLDVARWLGGASLRIESLEADSLAMHLQRHADGRANWGFDGRPHPPKTRVPWPTFGLLRIGDGSIRFEDAIKGHDLLLDVRGDRDAGSGYGARLRGHYRALPVDWTIRADGPLPLLPDESTRSTRVPLHVRGPAGTAQLVFDGVAASLINSQRLDGAVRFRGPSLADVGTPLGATLPRTPPFDIEGRLGHVGTIWTLAAERAAIGNSRLDGNFAYDPKARPKRLTGRLGGARLLLADLGPAVGTNGPDLPRPPVRVLPQRRFNLPSLKTMEADVAVALDELAFSGPALTPLRDLRTRLSLHDGVLTLDAVQARVAGGRLDGRTRYDVRKSPAAWTVELAFADVDLAGWIRGLHKRGGTGGQGPAWLGGTMTARLQLAGRGASTAEILGTLDGSVQARLADGSMSQLLTEIAGLDVAQALGVAVRGDRPLALNCAVVELAVNGGVVVPRRAVVDSRDSTITVGGRIDLRDETLALNAVSRPKDATPFSLRTPVTVGGTLSHPAVGIEAAPLAGRALAAIGLGIVAGPAALLPFVDLGSRGAADPCAAASQVER